MVVVGHQGRVALQKISSARNCARCPRNVTARPRSAGSARSLSMPGVVELRARNRRCGIVAPLRGLPCRATTGQILATDGGRRGGAISSTSGALLELTQCGGPVRGRKPAGRPTIAAAARATWRHPRRDRGRQCHRERARCMSLSEKPASLQELRDVEREDGGRSPRQASVRKGDGKRVMGYPTNTIRPALRHATRHRWSVAHPTVSAHPASRARRSRLPCRHASSISRTGVRVYARHPSGSPRARRRS